MAGGRTLTVVSYNIRGAIGTGPWPRAWWQQIRRDRMERIAAIIRGLEPDVVCVQEVGLGTADGVPFEQATELGALTGMEVRYGAAHHVPLVDADGERVVGAYLWGNAVLSRWPIRASTLHVLPTPADDDLVEPADVDPELGGGIRYADAPTGVRELRSLLACAIDIDGITIHALSTHLTYAGAGQRRAQVERIAEVVEALKGPVVIGGDFNASLDSPELASVRESLVDAFTASAVEPGDRGRHSFQTKAIDHILVRGLSPRSCRVATEAGDASDHWPVAATLELS